MSWDYRIIQTEEDGTLHYGIYEVYYDEDGTVSARTESTVSLNYPLEDQDEDELLEEIKKDLKHMKRALYRPILIDSELWRKDE